MQVPNWQKHSKKEQKPILKPQAMRARREALSQFKKRHMNPHKRRVSSYYESIRTNLDDCFPRDQIATC